MSPGLLSIGILAVAAVLTSSLCASLGLRRLREEHKIGRSALLLTASAGAVVGLVWSGNVDNSGASEGVGMLAKVFIAAFLGAAAYTDHRTGWAPDELTVPISVLSGAIAVSSLGKDFSFWIGSVAGFLVWVLAQLLWARLLRLHSATFPPADLLALLVPMATLGFGLVSMTVYAGCAAFLSAVRCGWLSRGLAGDASSMSAAECDLNGVHLGKRIALLGVIFPVNLAVILGETVL